MFRLWGKLITGNHLIRDIVVEDPSERNRTAKVFSGLEEIARAFQELADAGKVLDFGVSNQNPAMMERLAHYLPFELAANQVQISAAFTPMFDAFFNANMENDAAVMRDGGILEYCACNNMAIQAWSVLQRGYFGGVFLDNPDYELFLADFYNEFGRVPQTTTAAATPSAP